MDLLFPPDFLLPQDIVRLAVFPVYWLLPVPECRLPEYAVDWHLVFSFRILSHRSYTVPLYPFAYPSDTVQPVERHDAVYRLPDAHLVGTALFFL